MTGLRNGGLLRNPISSSSVTLPISEQSSVLPVGENLRDEDDGADSGCGLNGIDTAVCKGQLESPRVRERRGKTAARGQMVRNSILRNLVSGKGVLLQAQGPPLKLLSLFRLKRRLGGPGTRSDPHLACGEASQINGPPSPPQPSKAWVRR